LPCSVITSIAPASSGTVVLIVQASWPLLHWCHGPCYNGVVTHCLAGIVALIALALLASAALSTSSSAALLSGMGFSQAAIHASLILRKIPSWWRWCHYQHHMGVGV
jgi:hypothetical protein